MLPLYKGLAHAFMPPAALKIEVFLIRLFYKHEKNATDPEHCMIAILNDGKIALSILY